MEHHAFFMDWKAQLYPYVNSPQTGLQVQCNLKFLKAFYRNRQADSKI